MDQVSTLYELSSLINFTNLGTIDVFRMPGGMGIRLDDGPGEHIQYNRIFDSVA